MDISGDQSSDEPPKYGLKLPLNHEFPIQSKQSIPLSPKQIFELIPLSARYLKYYIYKKMHNRRPIMDYMHMVSAQRIYGCPIGGIGGGTIGRGYKGEFCRFQLNPGIYDYVTVPECQFIVNIRNGNNENIFQSVLSTYNKPKDAPASWQWNLNGADCEYTGLYPRAWTTYDLSKYGVKLVCKQISPVIPHNYKDSSLPCAVFVWSAKNVSNEKRTVSITFTWTEIVLNKAKSATTKLDIERYSEDSTCGLTMEQKICDMPCTFTVAKTKQENESIHDGYCMFDSSKNSKYVWECIKEHGTLHPETTEADEKKEKNNSKKNCRPNSVGLSSVLTMDSGGTDTTEFCLAWDMPVIKYKKENRIYKRFYTKYFGSDGIAGPSIAAYALKNYENWEKQIKEWQNPILNNCNIPDWLKCALFNQLYYVSDGGTIWFDVQDEYPDSDPRHHFGLFGYLEGHEYRMYNTYDVHFYASFALAQLWPNLQVVLQYMFRDTISLESDKNRRNLYDGKTVKYKIKDSIPHDLGDPDGHPFTHINAYNIHDVSEWRDLNLKFILQVMRDFRLLKCHSAPFGNDRYCSLEFIDNVRDGTENELYIRSTCQDTDSDSPVKPDSPVKLNGVVNEPITAGNILDMLYRNEERSDEGESAEKSEIRPQFATWDCKRYLVDMYEACVSLVRHMKTWDRDEDGLIENTGLPDQTFDAWIMTGPSAYCGGMWVAALCCVCNMARILGKDEDEKEFRAMLDRAKSAFEEKLWQGSYYKFDTNTSNSQVVMADQLAGLWFLHASGVSEEVFPEINVKKALKTIYENNVMKFNGGKMGAVNGWVLGDKNRAGHIDHSALQSEEMWTGVTYGLASLMIYQGMTEEAFVTAGGMYKTMTQMGLSYEFPEALYANGNHRSIGYMRPLAVWGMYQAVISRRPTNQTEVKNTVPNGTANHTKEII